MDVKLQDLPLTQECAQFIVGTSTDSLSSAALKSVKTAILDTIGVTLAASPRRVGKLISAFAIRGGGDGEATILGGGRKTSAPLAALANATMSNALDYDEGFHYATYVIPAALAVAERDNLSGAELIDGVVIGYEFGARLTNLVDIKRFEKKGPTSRGWWHPGLCGPLAAAATAARLMRFDEKQTRMALGIASCSSAGFRRNMGTMAKGLHSGLAARAGIEAADLARAGFTADESILEAPLGFIAAVCGPGEYDIPSLNNTLGKPFLLEKGPNIKAYPACVPGHSLIEMGIKMSPRIAHRLDDIEHIEADLHGFSLMRPEAKDEDEAGFSGAYLLASGLVHGAFNLSHITAEAVQDQRVRKLMAKIRHRPAAQKGVEHIDITMRTGEIVSDEGSERPRRLATDEEIDDKFIACCDGIVGTQAARELLKRLRELEKEATLCRITEIARG